MKKLLLLIGLSVGLIAVKAQTLYTTTTSGGKFGGGTLNKFSVGDNSLVTLKSFDYTQNSPLGFDRFVLALDGKFYGTSSTGGHKNFGFIFSFDPVSKVFVKLKDFDGVIGSTPSGGLIQGSDGKLYGLTRSGGKNDYGVIYSFDPTNSAYSKLKDFEGTDGRNGAGSLLKVSDGKLYGTTSRGGNGDMGVLFSYDPPSGEYLSLVEFNGTNGRFPVGDLIQASNGELYGMTESDPREEGGMVIFSFNILTKSLSVLKDFENDAAGRPFSNMVQASDGKLYGVLFDRFNDQGGSLFSFDPGSAIFTILSGYHNRDQLQGGLMLASNGKIYGMTMGGMGEVEYAHGSIFSYDPLSSSYMVEWDFHDVAGSVPNGILAEGPGGKLYGMTTRGGVIQSGGVFSFDISSGGFASEWDKGLSGSGSSPTGALTLGPDNKLYGMTTFGGTRGNGVIYSYDLSTSTFTKLKDFDFNEGANPHGGLLLLDGTDVLYGMTTGGGMGYGVLFSFDLSSGTYQKLKDFSPPDGTHPFGSLIQAKNGILYGLTSSGGAGASSTDGAGVIFSYDPKNSTFAIAHNFDNQNQFLQGDGSMPFGSLLEAKNGRLYGLTSKGRRDFGEGVLFCFDPNSSVYTPIYNFGPNGREPIGSLIQGSDGNLYGMTKRRENTGLGIIFSITPSVTNSYQLLHKFDSSGYYPYGDLMEASNGKLYGLTSEGGTHGMGTIFSYDLASRLYSPLKYFDNINGSFPLYSSRFVEVKDIPENTAPMISRIGNKIVNELEKLKFNVTASDADLPADTLTFSLRKSASGSFPEGASINYKTGLFSWIPTESQGPGNYRVKIVVSDGTSIDEEEVEIGVLEKPVHPVMAVIGAQSVNEGETLSFTASATDADLPATPLRFSLVKVPGTNFPDGATIIGETGLFAWTPTEMQGLGEYCLKVMVSDGECTDEEKILITVNEVNSPPTFSKGPDVTLFDDARRQLIHRWATNISAGAEDEEHQKLHFLVTTDNTQLFSEQPTISSDGTLTFAPTLNVCGIAKVAVVLNDSGGNAFGGSDKSNAQNFIITVNTADVDLFAYPNPFGKNAMVGFTLPETENLVILDLNDLKGGRLQRIYQGKGEANQTHQFAFDGSRLSPGIYFLRLVTSNNVKTFKIIMSE